MSLFHKIDDISAEAKISYADLLDKKTVQDFKHLAGECYVAAEAGPAEEFIGFFDNQARDYPTLRQDAPEAFKAYQDLRWLMVLTALATMYDEEIKQFFTKHFLRTIDFLPTTDIYKPDIRDNLERYFTLTNDGFDKGKRRQLISSYLQNNQEKLGNYVLQMGTGGGNMPPTLGNWIKDYEQYFPTFTVRGSLERLKYLNEGLNSRKLNGSDRARLTRALEIYDFVRFPTIALKEMGKGALLERAPFVSAGAEVVEAVSTKGVFVNLETEFNVAQAQVRAKTGGDMDKVVRVFYDNLFPIPGMAYDKWLVIGALANLASAGWLVRALEGQNPVRDAFVAYLRKEGAPDDLQGFQIAPIAPFSMGKFLKFVLARRLRLTESEAAQIAIYISNLLKGAGHPEYMEMVYYDQESGGFRWKG